jgi:cobalt-zinc-cadmium efflux system membrane fusion protein
MAVVAMAILTVACNQSTRPAAEAVEPKPEAARHDSADTVTLDAAGQKAGGIVVELVQARSVASQITAPGQLTFNEDRTWSAGALTDGRLADLRVKLGDPVRKGQSIADLHSHDVHDSRATYRSAQQEVARARSAEALAIRLRDRAKRLFDLSAMSREQLEAAEQELRNAEAATRTAEIAVEKARIHLEDYLGVPAEGDTHDVPVRAPEAGIVIERKATPGMVVTAGQEIVRIADPTSLWLIANVNEADLPALRIGQNVRITVRAYEGRTFAGRVLRLGEAVDLETRTLQVRVAIPNPGALLKPGMFAAVEIQRGPSTRQTVVTRESAVQDVNGQSAVFVETKPGSFALRPVLLGKAADGFVEVASGVKTGDRVVTKGSFILKSQMLKSSLAEE